MQHTRNTHPRQYTVLVQYQCARQSGRVAHAVEQARQCSPAEHPAQKPEQQKASVSSFPPKSSD
eukprot:NODE_2180_length_450_cov_21.069825_g2101_i0.p2 GENE.NODE_2180_length_450_cov_21.069825_g2101_i0~~NODE_2180_length_450_cov_21.069825_g2101_i0.p2  ORF type:complete len:64 (-),score=12.57 NODE_2180_length_450_cov_21.069825_g2101_i0:123-314(-)